MPRWTPQRSTDRSYLYGSLVSLAEPFALCFEAPDDWRYLAACTSEYLFERALGAAGAQVESSMLTPTLDPGARIEAVFSYGKYPRLRRDTPVLWEQTFAPQLGADLDDWRRHWRRVAAYPAAAATGVVTATQVSAEWFAQLFPSHAAKIHVVPYYFPRTRPISPANLAAKADGERPLQLLFVGKEARRKGLETFVRAWTLLSARTRSRVSVRVISAMLDGPVKLPAAWEHSNQVPDIASVMEAAHALVFPTKREAFGLVLVEALAAGCMALTTSAPIQRSIVGPDAGLFVEPTDASALAAAIESLSEDAARLRAGMSAARARFITVYEPSIVGRQYADLLYRVAGRDGPAPLREPIPKRSQ